MNHLRVSGFYYSWCLIFCFLVFSMKAQRHWDEVAQLKASDKKVGQQFGWAVAIHGDWAMVGAPTDDDNAISPNLNYLAGAVYVFKRDNQGNWIETQKLVASDRSEDSEFGQSLDLYGDVAVIGAPSDDNGGMFYENYGAVYIFEKDANDVWQQKQKLAPPQAFRSLYGNSVAIHEDQILVGCGECTKGAQVLTYSGAAYFYEKNKFSGIWEQKTKKYATVPHAWARFGFEVSLTDSVALIGAPYESLDEQNLNPLGDAGAAYIFRLNSQGQWNQSQKIVSSQRGIDYYFGDGVSISGEKLVVGAPGFDSVTANIGGAVYFFEEDSTGNWLETQQHFEPGWRYHDNHYGSAVQIFENTAIVGAPGFELGGFTKEYGAVFIYERQNNGNWQKIRRILASDKEDGDAFGFSLAVADSVIMVGNPFKALTANGNAIPFAGKVYQFGYACRKDTLKITQSGNKLIAHTSDPGPILWVYCDSTLVPVPGQNRDTLNIPANGRFLAIQFDSSGCVDSSLCFEVNNFKVDQTTDDKFVEIGPNPFKDKLYIKCSKSVVLELKLVNMSGQIILSEKLPPVTGGEVQLELGQLTPGTYMLQLLYSDSVQSTIIIKR